MLWTVTLPSNGLAHRSLRALHFHNTQLNFSYDSWPTSTEQLQSSFIEGRMVRHNGSSAQQASIRGMC